MLLPSGLKLLVRTADHGVILAFGADDPHFVQGRVPAFRAHEVGFPSLDAAPPLQTQITREYPIPAYLTVARRCVLQR